MSFASLMARVFPDLPVIERDRKVAKACRVSERTVQRWRRGENRKGVPGAAVQALLRKIKLRRVRGGQVASKTLDLLAQVDRHEGRTEMPPEPLGRRFSRPLKKIK